MSWKFIRDYEECYTLNVPTKEYEYETMQNYYQKDNWSIGEKNKTLEEKRIWKEETDNSLGKRNKTAFMYKTKEIKRLMNSKINGI